MIDKTKVIMCPAWTPDENVNHVKLQKVLSICMSSAPLVTDRDLCQSLCGCMMDDIRHGVLGILMAQAALACGRKHPACVSDLMQSNMISTAHAAQY